MTQLWSTSQRSKKRWSRKVKSPLQPAPRRSHPAMRVCLLFFIFFSCVACNEIFLSFFLFSLSKTDTLTALEIQNEPDFEQKDEVKPGSKVRALYKFEQRTPDEISFVENQTITIVKPIANSSWWWGEVSGQTGWFPVSYVEILTASSKRIWAKKYQPAEITGFCLFLFRVLLLSGSLVGCVASSPLSQQDKLKALMDMNQRSATLPARFRRAASAPTVGEPEVVAAAVAAAAAPSKSPPPSVVSSTPETIRPLPEIQQLKRPNSKSSLMGARRRSNGPSPVITTAPGGAVEAERWKDKVSTEVFESVSEKERQRQEVIFELLRTEKEYVRDLGIVIDVTSFSFLLFSLIFL